jgi:hypothetical protein
LECNSREIEEKDEDKNINKQRSLLCCALWLWASRLVDSAGYIQEAILETQAQQISFENKRELSL